jgi:hypothetical protein
MGFVRKKRGSVVCKPFLGKRADILHEIYFLIFQLFMVFVVVIALFQYINNVATDLGFEKKFTAIDLGLVTTTVYSAPGTLFHDYVPLPFPVPMNFVFSDSTVNIKERGKELNMMYWYLTDRAVEPVGEELPVPASPYADGMEEELQRLRDSAGGANPPEVNFTYYKSGRQLVFAKEAANAMQMVCPVLNTTEADWESNKVFIGKILSSQQDYSDAENPVNRIAQIISSRHSQVQVSGASSSGSGGASAPAPSSARDPGSLISAIPADAKIVLIMGDSGEGREPGSLVAYVPVNSNLMKSRKFACFLLNDLLTPEAVVFYVQIMPVYVDDIEDTSPLRVLREISAQGQVVVFLDISKFTKEQVDVDTVSDAVYRSIERYYGGYGVREVSGATFRFTGGGAGGSSGAIAPPAPAPSASSGTYGVILNNEQKDSLLAELARQNNFEFAVLKAFFIVESGGRGFGSEGQLKIRMEPHVFNRRCSRTEGTWGTSENPDNTRANRKIAGISCEGGNENEHACLVKAVQLASDCGYKAISMGIPQIMGFHHALLGYAGPREMFDDFSRSEEIQIRKFIEFLVRYRDGGVANAIRARDWDTMARLYNGDTTGRYSGRLVANYRPGAAPAGGGSGGAAPAGTAMA